MILITLGTQDFPFNRLLAEVDRLIEEKVIQEDVVAQIGYSTYIPKHYAYKDFTTFDEFERLLEECSLLITHGGTGTIVGGLRKRKNIIAVPRLCTYQEHVDDHQKEIIAMFAEKRMIVGLDDVRDLRAAIEGIGQFQPQPYVSGNQKIVNLIENFINGGFNSKPGKKYGVPHA